MKPLSPDVRLLGIRLGLGDLNHSRSCWGYQTGCICPPCREREENGGKAKSCPRQPWEPQRDELEKAA